MKKPKKNDVGGTKRKGMRRDGCGDSDDTSSMLRNAGLKATPTRLALLSAFPDDCKPVNAEFLIKKLSGKKTTHATDQATVYRNLTAFEKASLIRRIDLHKDSTYYEIVHKDGHDHHHHHIICTACGLIEGFEICMTDSIMKSALSTSMKFESIKDHSLELFGICVSCSKNQCA